MSECCSLDESISDCYSFLSFYQTNCIQSTTNIVDYVGQLAHRVCRAVKDFLLIPFNYVRSSIAYAYFFPLYSKLDFLPPEKQFYDQFWSGEKRISRLLVDYPKIIEKFHPPRDHSVSVTLQGGKQMRVVCSVTESKTPNTALGQAAEAYNFFFVAGNHSRRDISVMETYPYMGAFVRQAEENPNIQRGRFITLSFYDIFDPSANPQPIIPTDLDECGEILFEVMKQLNRDFGNIEQMVGFSLGTILIGSMLKYITESDLPVLPKNVCLDRGPRSILHASLNVSGGLGLLIFPAAYCTGWSLNLEEELTHFFERFRTQIHSENRTWILSSVNKDWRFNGVADLSRSPGVIDLQNKGDVKVLRFDPTDGFIHNHAHHSMHAGMLIKDFLPPNSSSNGDLLGPDDSLADAVIRTSQVFERSNLRAM